METVSYTSQWTAAARALETERDGDGLFEDPLARRLAEPDGFKLLDKYGGGGLVEFVAIRTRYFDDTIADLLAATPIRQVVLIAAGMDTRAYRLSWPDDVTVYEVDHADLLAEKERRLAGLDTRPAASLCRVGADLSGDWLPSLREAGFDPRRSTLWVAEALLFFLTDEQAAGLLRTLRSASAAGSWLAVDILGRQLLRSPATQIFLSALKADGIPWLFGTDHPEAFLAGTGWRLRELREPGEPGAGEGRWPYEVQPRQVKGVSRNWLIRAEAGEVHP